MKITPTVLLFWLLSQASAQDANCDFVQNVQAGLTYNIHSPNYPRNYTGGVVCRWQAVCPSGYNCRLDCPQIDLPQTQSCNMDKLLISRSGDPQLAGAETYCGRGSLSIVSTGQKFVIGLITSKKSPGGGFSCQLKAQLPMPSSQCRCGERRQNRIVGGQETGVNEYRMMVGLADVALGQIKCGALLISNRHVLTAAQCVQNKLTTDILVIVGEHNVTTGSETSATKAYRVQNYTIHPRFSNSNYDYDIAIVTVERQIEFNNGVGPACLPFKFQNNSFAGSKVTALGWGTLFSGGPDSKVLQKVTLDVISQSSCKSKVPSLTDRQMCTYTAGKDDCQDDTGGPLLYTDPATGLLFGAGIFSYTRSCASAAPSINTRVTMLLDWIVANAPYTYCVK